MNKKRLFIAAIIAAVVIALYYYLRGDGGTKQVVYPNTQASGVPASQNAGSTWNIQTPQAGPSPAAIYAPPLSLPPTPNFQYSNYAPLNIYGLTSQAAQTATPPPAKDKDSSCCSSSCGSCSSCPTCPTGGSYGDGNSAPCLASNPSQPVSKPSATLSFMSAAVQSFFPVDFTPIPTGNGYVQPQDGQ